MCVFTLGACVKCLPTKTGEGGSYVPAEGFKRNLRLAQGSTTNSLISMSLGGEYKCAKYCSCTYKPVMSSRSTTVKVNMSQARCEDLEFNDILSLDRRTQIIHISLPTNGSVTEDYSNEQPVDLSRQFRMPRLVQFNALREIVIVHLRFEICDSEVFKKGQNLRRIQWNHNHLGIISKACLKHLDKLVDLDLSFNRLEELESALFSSLINLRSLTIAHNQLSELAAHQFANLTKLTSLNLVGNKFKSINLHLFEPMQSSLRLLLLSNNQIKSFVHTTPSPMSIAANLPVVNGLINNRTSPLIPARTIPSNAAYFVGTIFKSLIKLNVDQNKLERIKSLQLHRFYNVKFLSIRRNNIATIRDKAFNGLKLIELNLAENKLQTVSKCAFCNATIKRLILAKNNITIPLPSVLIDLPNIVPAQSLAATMSKGISSGESLPDETTSSTLGLAQSTTSPLPTAITSAPTTSSHASQNVLILSQSIFGPLFANLEYLDISGNEYLADDLELLLEPLLELKYLNLASTGLDEALPTPTLFKNLHMLRYLNLSHNQLDQLVSETMEPLTSLKVLDLSFNRFSEMDESFLVTLEELPTLELVHFGSNPWYCSQCKIGPLYEWIFRSPIYNSTCLVPLTVATSTSAITSTDIINGLPNGLEEDLIAAEHQSDSKGEDVATKSVDYSLLIDDDWQHLESSDTSKFLTGSIDFDIVLDSSNSYEDDAANYHLATENGINSTMELANGDAKPTFANKPLNMALLMTLITDQDDLSVAHTINSLTDVVMSPSIRLAREFCLRCEFPGELRSSFIHELSSADFKYCAGSAPRLAASEPKIGLTLAIVIILALFCIIIVVIVIYRKKSNTYYPNEETDRLDQSGTTGAMPKGKHPVLSVSSDMDHQYGDGTDYSSPPVSQPYESYSDESPGDELGEEEDEEGDYDEDEEDEEGEYEDEDEDEGEGDGDYDEGGATGEDNTHEDVKDEDQHRGGGDSRNESDETGAQQSSGALNESDKNQTTGNEATQATLGEMSTVAEEDSRSDLRHADNENQDERATNTSRSSDKNTSTSRSLERRSVKGKSHNKSNERTDSNRTEQQTLPDTIISGQVCETKPTRSSIEQATARSKQQTAQQRQSVETTGSEEQVPPMPSCRPRQSLTKSLTTASRKQRPLVLKGSLSKDTGQQVQVSKGLAPKVPGSSSGLRRNPQDDSTSNYICETPLVESLVETASQMSRSTTRNMSVDSNELTSQRITRQRLDNTSLDQSNIIEQPPTDHSSPATIISTLPRAARLLQMASGSQSRSSLSQKSSLQEEPQPIMPAASLQVKFAKSPPSASEVNNERRSNRSETKQSTGTPRTLPRRQLQSHALEALRERPKEMLNNVVADATSERALKSRNQPNPIAQPIRQAKLIRLGSQTGADEFNESASRIKMADTRFTAVGRQAAVVNPQMIDPAAKATSRETNGSAKNLYTYGSMSSSVGSSGVAAGTSGTSADCNRRSIGLTNRDSDSNLSRLKRMQPTRPEFGASRYDARERQNINESVHQQQQSQQQNIQSHLHEDGRNIQAARLRQQPDIAAHLPTVARSRELISRMPKQARAVMSPAISSEASTLADSLAFEGLEDLPSDLDIDALVEIPDENNNESPSNYETSYSPAATLIDEDLPDENHGHVYRRGDGIGKPDDTCVNQPRQMITGDSGRGMSRSSAGNQLRPSNSTHSALTRSSSREFNVSASPNPPG